MPDIQQKVTIFASDEAEGDKIAEMVAGIPATTCETRYSTLARANGAVFDIAARGNIIVFRTKGAGGDDLSAAEALCARLGDDARLLAISDPDLPLSEVRKLLAAGVADVLPSPVTREEFETSLARLRRSAVAVMPDGAVRKAGKVISVAQARGGIGATTLAVNLADALRGETGLMKKASRNKVAILDLDLQFGSVASFLDVTPNEALAQIAADGTVPDATFLSQSLVQSAGGLHVMAAPAQFVPLEAMSREQIGGLLEHLSLQFDYVVVDLPRTLVHWIQAVLDRSDQLLLVTDSTVPSIRTAKRLIDAYSDENPTLPIEVVINHEAKPMMRGRHHVQAAKLLERELRIWLPDDARAAREAIDRGVPLGATAKGSKLNKAIRRLARDIEAGDVAERGASPKANQKGADAKSAKGERRV